MLMNNHKIKLKLKFSGCLNLKEEAQNQVYLVILFLLSTGFLKLTDNRALKIACLSRT